MSNKKQMELTRNMLSKSVTAQALKIIYHYTDCAKLACDMRKMVEKIDAFRQNESDLAKEYNDEAKDIIKSKIAQIKERHEIDFGIILEWDRSKFDKK